eukprot:TRINITY_DN45962_c0_g1_i4.p1 TRINITY_DN45962_c0_g1~~TRINITY_DN45962_c0_g1_i4.p1  ORF type:complete len:1582 (-),score=595.33 TRINITY_DN45962_c0_g1_i4:379-5124(-)
MQRPSNPILASIFDANFEAFTQLFKRENGDIKLKDAGGRSPLHLAAFSGAKSILETLLEIPEADINVVDSKGLTALHLGSFKCNLEIVQFLVERGSNVLHLDSLSRSPLHLAALNGSENSLAVVKYLLDSLKDTEIDLPTKGSLFSFACMGGNKDVVQLLLKRKVFDLNFENAKDGTTPLHDASSKGHSQILECLIDAGFGLEKQDRRGFTALHHAVAVSRPNCIEWLLQNGACAAVKDKDGRTCLEVFNIMQTRRRDKWAPKLIELMTNNCSKPVECGVPKPTQPTDTSILVRWKQSPILKCGSPINGFEIQYIEKANFKKWSKSEWLSALVLIEDVEVNEVKVASGRQQYYWFYTLGDLQPKSTYYFRIRARNGNGWGNYSVKSDEISTMAPMAPQARQRRASSLTDDGINLAETLLGAAKDGDEECVNNILQEFINPSKLIRHSDRSGRTALHLACWKGYTSIANSLIKYGANVHALDKANVAPVHLASFGGHVKCLELVEENEGDLMAADAKGFSCLHYATIGNHEECIKWLLRKGLSHQTTNRDGTTVMAMANSAPITKIFEDFSNPPPPPSGLQLLNVTAYSITIKWNPCVLGEMTQPVLGYEVSYARRFIPFWETAEASARTQGNEDMSSHKLFDIVPGSGGQQLVRSLPLTIFGLDPETKFRIRIRALNSRGWSGYHKGEVTTLSEAAHALNQRLSPASVAPPASPVKTPIASPSTTTTTDSIQKQQQQQQKQQQQQREEQEKEQQEEDEVLTEEKHGEQQQQQQQKQEKECHSLKEDETKSNEHDDAEQIAKQDENDSQNTKTEEEDEEQIEVQKKTNNSDDETVKEEELIESDEKKEQKDEIKIDEDNILKEENMIRERQEIVEECTKDNQKEDETQSNDSNSNSVLENEMNEIETETQTVKDSSVLSSQEVNKEQEIIIEKNTNKEETEDAQQSKNSDITEKQKSDEIIEESNGEEATAITEISHESNDEKVINESEVSTIDKQQPEVNNSVEKLVEGTNELKQAPEENKELPNNEDIVKEHKQSTSEQSINENDNGQQHEEQLIETTEEEHVKKDVEKEVTNDDDGINESDENQKKNDNNNNDDDNDNNDKEEEEEDRIRGQSEVLEDRQIASVSGEIAKIEKRRRMSATEQMTCPIPKPPTKRGRSLRSLPVSKSRPVSRSPVGIPVSAPASSEPCAVENKIITPAVDMTSDKEILSKFQALFNTSPVECTNLDIVSELETQFGITSNNPMRCAFHPIHACVLSGNGVLLEKLLNGGYELDCDKDDVSPLHMLCLRPSFGLTEKKLLDILICRYTNEGIENCFKMLDRVGHTPLMYAVMGGSIEWISEILKRDSERESTIAMQNKAGMSALHVLASGLRAFKPNDSPNENLSQMAGIARVLIENGCLIQQKDKNGQTAHEVACLKNPALSLYLTLMKTPIPSTKASLRKKKQKVFVRFPKPPSEIAIDSDWCIPIRDTSNTENNDEHTILVKIPEFPEQIQNSSIEYELELVRSNDCSSIVDDGSLTFISTNSAQSTISAPFLKVACDKLTITPSQISQNIACVITCKKLSSLFDCDDTENDDDEEKE